MPETGELLNEVTRLRRRVDEQGEVLDVLVQLDGAQAKVALLDRLADDELLRAIYMRVDGARTQGAILADLAAVGVRGANKATVSRRFDELANDLKLIVLVPRKQLGKVYRKSSIDRTFNLTRELERRST